MDGYVFDIEADNLYLQSKNIWYGYFKSLDGSKEMEIFPFKETPAQTRKKILDFHGMFEDPLVVTFNGLGYDHWMFWKFFDISFHVGKQGSDWINRNRVSFLDLYVLSQYLDPDRPRHSLASYGEELGNGKIDFHDFSEYSEDMREYGKQDVNLTLDVYNHLIGRYRDLYNTQEMNQSLKCMHKDYYLYAAQEFTGIRFDKEKALNLVPRIEKEMQEIEENVVPQLPNRTLKKTEEKDYKMPAKPFKMDGTASASLLKFCEKHGCDLDFENKKIIYNGEGVDIVSNSILPVKLQTELKDGTEIKDWFMEQGWVPTMWNLKRDPDTKKPMRDTLGNVIKTSPKIQENGKICPSLEALNGELPQKIVRYLSLRNRLSVVQGWLQNWRLDFDGRLSASITGYTPTTRVKHSVVVNLPKASDSVILGREMRSLFTVDKDMVYVSGDAAGLENRTIADYTYKYDGGAYADLVLKGDSHSYNAKAFFPDELKRFDIDSPDFDKDDPGFKPYRDKTKNGVYSLTYGAGVPKFTSTIGVSKKKGEEAYKAYWDKNPGLKKFKDRLEKYWAKKGKKKYILAKDCQLLVARSKHLLVNLAGQSLGAKVLAYAFCIFDNHLGHLDLDNFGKPYYNYKGKVVKRIAAFHDQGDFECDPEIAQEIGEIFIHCILKAGQFLDMKVKLDGEFKIGKNGAEIH